MQKLNIDLIKKGADYQKLKNKITMIAQSEPVKDLQEELVTDVLEHAQKAISVYDSNKNVQAGKKLSVDGMICGTLAVAAFTTAKKAIPVDNPEIDNLLSLVISSMIAAGFAFVKGRIFNWMKNH